MRASVVYRRPCCGVSLTIQGTPNGDEAYAEKGIIRLLSSMCHCPSRTAMAVEKQEVSDTLYGYCLVASKTVALGEPQKQR